MNPEMHDLVGAYCTDALDATERAAFEAHLARCAACRSEAASYLDALATIGATHPVVPPVELEEAVLAAARREQGGHGHQGGEDVDQQASGRGGAGDPAAAGGPGPAGDRAAVVRAWPRAAPRLAVAAAGAVLFSSGFVIGDRTGRGPDPGAEQMAAVVALAAAPDAHFLTVEIMGTRSRVVMSGQMDQSAFIAADLPTPAKGMCYQVWRVTADGSMASAGAFTPDVDGHIAAVLEGSTHDVVKYVITMEPPGGSQHPTGTMLSEVRA